LGKRYDIAALLPPYRYNEVTEWPATRHIVVRFMFRGSQSVQSFQPGSKLRFFVFQAVVLVFFAVVAAQTPAQTSSPAATTTSLAIATQDSSGRTQATFDVNVVSPNGAPTGTVSVMKGDYSLGSAVLDANGHAKLSVDALPSGTQKITAVYNGDNAHAASSSLMKPLDSTTSGVADYTIQALSTSFSIAPGDTASTTVTVTPENGFNQFVSFSCSGLPPVSSCVFTPATVSTAAGTAISATLTIQTTALSGSTGSKASLVPAKPSGLFYALAFPGVLALVGIGGVRKRRHFAGQLLCMALLLGASLGLTACSQRYDYFHHGPGVNTGTPAGTYPITVTASSDNGLAETSHTLTLTLTIQ
jgi:Bacterial Ig-like domain (group 3)